jgi:hypothetical protein
VQGDISVPIDSLPFDLLVIERLIGEAAMIEKGLPRFGQRQVLCCSCDLAFKCEVFHKELL